MTTLSTCKSNKWLMQNSMPGLNKCYNSMLSKSTAILLYICHCLEGECYCKNSGLRYYTDILTQFCVTKSFSYMKVCASGPLSGADPTFWENNGLVGLIFQELWSPRPKTFCQTKISVTVLFDPIDPTLHPWYSFLLHPSFLIQEKGPPIRIISHWHEFSAIPTA